MKNCLLCGTVSPDDAVTCPACGEASWEQVPTRNVEAFLGDKKIESVRSVEFSSDDRRSKRGRR